LAKRNAEKLILIGLGTVNPDHILNLVSQGKMPALADLIKRGTIAENCLAPFPTDTSASWTSTVTGAWPGTHGRGLRPGDCLKAATLWNAAAGQERPSILIDCGVRQSVEGVPEPPPGSAGVSIYDGIPGLETGQPLSEEQLLTTLSSPQVRAWPTETEKELLDLDNFSRTASSTNTVLSGRADLKKCSELAQVAHSQYAAAAVRIMDTVEWQLFFMHDLVLTAIHRALASLSDKSQAPQRERAEDSRELPEAVYESLDTMIGRILEKADRRTLVVLASDHGVIPRGPALNANKVLADAGLAVLKDDGEIDWALTKAACVRDVHVVVNLKSREPHGIVEPDDYEDVREQAIKALMDHVDPGSRKRPVAFALRREDARIFGIYGDCVGDVVLCVEPGHGLECCHHLPTAKWGTGALRSLLLLAGPNVKKRTSLQRNVWLVDIAPTICYLMDIPFPETMEGAILYQALQDPNFRITEKSRLAANYDRLKRAYDAEISLTHTYNR